MTLRSGAKPLAKVADPQALDRCDGAHAAYEIVVPGAWLVDGGGLEIELPRLLSCARCDGGGCDRCQRSGALRMDGPERTVEVHLPSSSSKSAVKLRLARPLDDDRIAQLILTIKLGDVVTNGVSRVNPMVVSAPRQVLAQKRLLVIAALVLVVVGVVAILL